MKLYTNSFKVPFPQFFGVGISNLLGEKVKALGAKKVLVIYDKGIEAAGISGKILKNLDEAGIAYITFNGVEADPPDTLVNDLGARAVAEKADCLVAVGGGSSIDTAKGVRVLTANEGPISKYFDLRIPQKPGIPLIAIPTTSGTGSEVTGGCVITNTSSGAKVVVSGAGSTPAFSLVDPELTVAAPPNVSAACAFDALAHDVGAAMSKTTSRMGLMLCSESIKLFKKSLHTVYKDGSNIEARADMALAANLGGIAITNGSCNIDHSFAHALGAAFHVPHGVACAIFTPACLEYNAALMPDEIRILADAFDVKYSSSDSSEKIGRMIAEAVYGLACSVKIPTLKDLVPNREDAYDKIIPLAMKDLFVMSTPKPLDLEGAKWIIDTTYGY